jgi:RNAse (barnase) inhibitor barstar
MQTIELGSIESVEQLHDIFKDSFDFPEFYGKNWDAFWDMITGFVEMPEELRLINAGKFKQAFRKDYQTLIDIIEEYNALPYTKRIVITES